MKPTPSSERIDVLDFLRGMAIFGILFINIETFAYPESWSPYSFGFHEPIDRTVRFWVYFLTQGKFYTLFALLFGVGFYQFLERIEQRTVGLQALDLYARRLFWLFLMGVGHAYLLWTGDVLYHYAICGLLLFPFRSMTQGQMVLAISILALLIAIPSYERVERTLATEAAAAEIRSMAPGDRTGDEQKRLERWKARLTPGDPNRDHHVPPKPNFWTGLQDTLKQIEVHNGMVYHRGLLFRTLMVMLIGIVLYRSGIFSDYRAWHHYWIGTGILLAVALAINFDRYHHWTYDYFNPMTSQFRQLLHGFSKELLGIAYMLFFNGMYQASSTVRKASLVNLVGRTALSNYILQSILLGLLFYGYGLGQFNQWSRSSLLGWVLLIWTLQLVVTNLWMKHHDRGPLEALWRALIYRRFRNRNEKRKKRPDTIN